MKKMILPLLLLILVGCTSGTTSTTDKSDVILMENINLNINENISDKSVVEKIINLEASNINPKDVIITFKTPYDEELYPLTYYSKVHNVPVEDYLYTNKTACESAGYALNNHRSFFCEGVGDQFALTIIDASGMLESFVKEPLKDIIEINISGQVIEREITYHRSHSGVYGVSLTHNIASIIEREFVSPHDVANTFKFPSEGENSKNLMHDNVLPGYGVLRSSDASVEGARYKHFSSRESVGYRVETKDGVQQLEPYIFVIENRRLSVYILKPILMNHDEDVIETITQTMKDIERKRLEKGDIEKTFDVVGLEVYSSNR